MCGKTIVGDYLKSFKHPIDNGIPLVAVSEVEVFVADFLLEYLQIDNSIKCSEFNLLNEGGELSGYIYLLDDLIDHSKIKKHRCIPKVINQYYALNTDTLESSYMISKAEYEKAIADPMFRKFVKFETTMGSDVDTQLIDFNYKIVGSFNYELYSDNFNPIQILSDKYVSTNAGYLGIYRFINNVHYDRNRSVFFDTEYTTNNVYDIIECMVEYHEKHDEFEIHKLVKHLQKNLHIFPVSKIDHI